MTYRFGDVVRSIAIALALGAGTVVPLHAWGQVADADRVIVVPNIQRPWPGREGSVEVRAADASIEINGQVSTTTLELTLFNPGSRAQEAQVLLPVPDGVAVRSLRYDGAGPEPKAEVLSKEEARRIYNDIVSKMRDPALVEFAGYNLIRTSVFPVPAGGSQKVALTYEQVLSADGNRVDYVLPRAEASGAGSVTWTISADIRADRPISTVFSPTHDITTQRDGDKRVRVKLGEINAGRGAVRFSYVLGGTHTDGLSATTLLYPDPEIGGGYFLLLGGLPDHVSDGRHQKREVTIVIDRSGSMRDKKLGQAIDAATQIVRGLDAGELFNIVDYSDSISSFATSPVVKDDETRLRAEKYIAGLRADGGTNLHDAVIEALRGEPRAGCVPLVLFLTDGLPTVGERSEVKIREDAKASNRWGRRIFTFGVGFDVNTPLLVNLAQTSRGASTFVLPDENLETKVSQVFRRLTGPLMVDPRLVDDGADKGDRRIRELQPGTLPDLFEGDQVLVLGQYKGEAPFKVHIDGKLLGHDQSFDVAMDPREASARNGYVARLWANRKITAMVDEIRQAGADGKDHPQMKELVDEIVRLSMKYGILTEYTAFLAKEETSFSGGVPALRPAADVALRERAVQGRSGAAGVSQQMDMSQKAAPAAAGKNVGNYVDADMKQVEVYSVQNVADGTFYQRHGRWIDARLLKVEGEKPDEVVEFGSDRYMALVEKLASEGRQGVLAQGGDVYLLVDGKRILFKAP